MQSHRELIVEPVGLDVETLPRPIVWEALFENANPVEIEIGMGKGTFLTEQAKARPEVNFLGIEWARWFWRYASDRMRRSGCGNARTVRAEAGVFLTEFVPAGGGLGVAIFFLGSLAGGRRLKRGVVFAEVLPLVGGGVVGGGGGG